MVHSAHWSPPIHYVVWCLKFKSLLLLNKHARILRYYQLCPRRVASLSISVPLLSIHLPAFATMLLCTGSQTFTSYYYFNDSQPLSLCRLLIPLIRVSFYYSHAENISNFFSSLSSTFTITTRKFHISTAQLQ